MEVDRIRIDGDRLEEINVFFTDKNNPLIRDIHRVIGKYGTPSEINEKANEARKLENLMKQLEGMNSPYLKELEWLASKRDQQAFVSISEYRQKVFGDDAGRTYFNESNAVTLEISALQYFPWLVAEARQAIESEEVMPGRFIRVRNMKEQERDQGDTLAIAAAMEIMGASYVETLDTKGTDGSNIHLNGPDTITGYFGGIGQPNDHPLKWIDEYLYYYTRYGIKQVLNINPGTVFIAYILHKLGIDIEFKISVFMGNDNPYSVLWTLMMARLFSRDDGSTPLVGFNLSNAVNNETIIMSSYIRNQLGLENNVRIEHHITETYRSIVKQPYDRRDELMELARTVPNIAAKHEGGDPEVEAEREHSSSILDYFRAKEEIIESGDMEKLQQNYLDKHQALNHTASELTRNGLSFIAATKLHLR